MDTDNRVVLNCGGIRHEVYKVNVENDLSGQTLNFSIGNSRSFKLKYSYLNFQICLRYTFPS